ncbi:sugar phosphate isomerase/epimerase [Scopulibacillus darangshiensis]|uniref:Sugar phosphate isomerase/epimerase n=1 Tax=Scopulibacillus darangshiensis TaxID=442528 RepID=A0A4R2NPE5_9BACL|nr:sugar phosphate isomerase/epimerase [Scopulibacillus darangshiensis]
MTFREFSVERIIDLAKKAGVGGIEWGGDVHVPPGNLARALDVADLTAKAGLSIVSYGSYYRSGCENDVPFDQILKTAITLGAPSIRVWAGNRGSIKADEQYWKKVIWDTERIAALAEESCITIHIEYHGGTLTDTRTSASRLMKAITQENVKAYWQPPVGEDVDTRLRGMKEIEPWLSHVHVFHWDNRDRRPLNEGKAEWKRYLGILAGLQHDHYAMLEFVKENDPEQFLRDADTLQILIDQCEWVDGFPFL